MGWAQVEHFRGGELLQTFLVGNDVTYEGRWYLIAMVLQVFGGPFVQKGNWQLGLIDAAGFSTVSASDSHPSSNHPGWTEITTGIEGPFKVNRQIWPRESIPTSLDVNQYMLGKDQLYQSSTGQALFYKFTAQQKVKGAFLTSGSGIGTELNADVLFSTMLFPSELKVSVGDAMRIAYQVPVKGTTG